MDIYKYSPASVNLVQEEAKQSWEIDRIEYKEGIKIYLKGCDFPQKGMPTPESILSVNQVKKVIKRIHIFIRSWTIFEELFWPIVQPFILKEEYQTPFTKEFAKFFNGKSALIISHIFEYDWAYRLRLQDLFFETTKEDLIKQPYREVRRLIKLNSQRDYEENVKKFKYIPYLFLIPSVRRKFRESLKEIEFTRLQPDEGDMFWMLQRIDYDSFGLTFKERENMLESKGWKTKKGTPISSEMTQST